jgi:hypothetical protein
MKLLDHSGPVQRAANLALPELTVALHLAVIASAGFVIDVVPVMSCAQSLAILPFFQNPPEKSWQNDAEVGPPPIRLFPIKAACEHTMENLSSFGPSACKSRNRKL